MGRNRLYSLLFVACLAGYIWLYYSKSNHLAEDKSVEVCLMKHVTGIPCPSCGSTRSIISLTQGNYFEALGLNPLGYLLAIIMIVAPVWIVADIITGRNSLYNWYQKIEGYLKKPMYSIPLLILIFINWMWNITKGL